MSGNDCEMKIEFHATNLLNKVASVLEVEFLTEKSKPTNYIEAIQAARHLLKSLSESFRDMADETRLLVHFAKEMKFDGHVDREAEFKRAMDSVGVPDFLKKILTDLMDEHEKRTKGTNKDGR
jgi:Fic family protein